MPGPEQQKGSALPLTRVESAARGHEPPFRAARDGHRRRPPRSLAPVPSALPPAVGRARAIVGAAPAPRHVRPVSGRPRRLPQPPTRALDVGTSTGGGALEIAARFPTAEVVGVDFSPVMVAQAASKIMPTLAGRVSFRWGDASSLPFRDAEFDLVAHNNMIPFFDEVTRVLRSGGHALFAFSSGAQTPIYVPPERLRAELERRGFSDFAFFSRARGTSLVARKR